jgi:hypothetical protein
MGRTDANSADQTAQPNELLQASDDLCEIAVTQRLNSRNSVSALFTEYNIATDAARGCKSGILQEIAIFSKTKRCIPTTKVFRHKNSAYNL